MKINKLEKIKFDYLFTENVLVFLSNRKMNVKKGSCTERSHECKKGREKRGGKPVSISSTFYVQLLRP